jgi:hypothetical protein
MTSVLTFEPQEDLIGMKHGFVEDTPRGRVVFVSPAVYSLLQTDKMATMDSLHVRRLDGELVHILDLQGGSK